MNLKVIEEISFTDIVTRKDLFFFVCIEKAPKLQEKNWKIRFALEYDIVPGKLRPYIIIKIEPCEYSKWKYEMYDSVTKLANAMEI